MIFHKDNSRVLVCQVSQRERAPKEAFANVCSRIGIAAIVLLVGGCGRAGFEILDTDADGINIDGGMEPVESAVSHRICDRAYAGQATLSCSAGETISEVVFASWGRPGGGCGDYILNSFCHASRSSIVVREECLGKNTCNVGANNSVFGGDPCPGWNKRLFIEVVCTATGSDPPGP
jgi:hypothetical protein